MDANIRFLLIRIALLGVVAGLQVLWYRLIARTIFSAETGAGPRRLLRMFLIAINAPGMYLVFGSGLALPHWLHALLIYPYTVWLGASTFLLACHGLWRLLRAAGKFLFHGMRARFRARRAPRPAAEGNAMPAPFPSFLPADPTRRAFVRTVAAGAAIYSFGGATLGVLSRDQCEIVRRPVRIKNLPARLAGLRIAFLADIHAGLFMTEEDITAYVRSVNGLKPDLVLLGGDFVTNQTAEIYPACEALQRLRAPLGVYACLGNHDFYAEPDIIANELRRANIRLLRDAHEVIEISNEPLALIGVDDIRGGVTLTRRLEKATRALDPTLPSILLCHKPYYFEETDPFRIDLVLSGHTHGGQIVIADFFDLPITPASLISKYVRGMYAREDAQMYVSRGIGTVGLPIRLNCPPEITLFELS